jgi:hypothetical protein
LSSSDEYRLVKKPPATGPVPLVSQKIFCRRRLSGLTRVECKERDAELAEAREQLGLHCTMDRIVDALVDGGLDPAVGLAEHGLQGC